MSLGCATLFVADIVLAAAPNLWMVSAPVADEAPPSLRTTAFGMFNFASGIALLLASLIAGFLWEMIGPSATFLD